MAESSRPTARCKKQREKLDAFCFGTLRWASKTRPTLRDSWTSLFPEAALAEAGPGSRAEGHALLRQQFGGGCLTAFAAVTGSLELNSSACAAPADAAAADTRPSG